MVDTCYNSPPPIAEDLYEYAQRAERGNSFSPLLATESTTLTPGNGGQFSPQRGARLRLYRPQDSNGVSGHQAQEHSDGYGTSRETTCRRLITRGRYHPADAIPRPDYTSAPSLRRQDAFRVTTCFSRSENPAQANLLERLGILYDDHVAGESIPDTFTTRLA